MVFVKAYPIPSAFKGKIIENIDQLLRNSRGSCGSRISLAATNSKLWITKHHMIHNHSPLPEDVIIDQSIRRLQVQEAGKDEFIISDGNISFICQTIFLRCTKCFG